MTPLALSILLHYYISPTDWDCITTTHDAVRKHLERDGLLASSPPPYICNITEKGRAFIDAVLDLPLPISMWVIPRRRNTQQEVE